MGFGIKKAFKSVKKRFKKVAKGVKKLAKKTMSAIMKTPILGKAIKGFGKLYEKTFGKLGPLGMIAASFVLPGVGGLLSQAWSGLAGSLTASGSGFLGAIGNGMTAVSNAMSQAGSFVSKGFSNITDKISGVFQGSGGTDNFFSKASEWVGQKWDAVKQNFNDAGDWMKQKLNIGTGPTEAESLLQANPELRSAANQTARTQFDAITDTQKALATRGMGQEELSKGINEAFAQNSDLVKETVLKTQGTEMASPTTLGQNLFDTTQGRAAADAGSSTLKSVAKAGASLLSGMGGEQDAGFAPVFDTPSFSAIGSQRQGIGGVGATPGAFLTPAQQQFFQQHASLLGQVG